MVPVIIAPDPAEQTVDDAKDVKMPVLRGLPRPAIDPACARTRRAAVFFAIVSGNGEMRAALAPLLQQETAP
ncbi:hypothetical protein [Burkholderia gladioli]|uniref:hypothetical protein n=1 Tax=Burkholderia gladioli TaxID=28095 RepID=UPI001641397C|nr:hypothetical protein [Burkholderia gladioli]